MPIEGDRLQTQGQGAVGTRDSRSANGPPRWIQHVRIVQPVCIVFISLPEIELCVLCVYSACILLVKCLVPVVYLSPVGTLPTSMCFPRVWCGIDAVHTVWSPNNTKHAKYTDKTHKYCQIIS